MLTTATPTLPKDPFKRGIYIYDTVTDVISHDQMINESFLNPDFDLSKIYTQAGLRQLILRINQVFSIALTAKDLGKVTTIGDLCSAVYDKLAK